MALKVNQISGMPQMGDAFSGWQFTITLTKITQVVVQGLLENSEKVYTFKGVIQPLDPRKIQLKPEGQRAFTWLQIHCLPAELDLSTNDIIVYKGKRYKIMGVYDYSLNNFFEYHAIEDYQE